MSTHSLTGSLNLGHEYSMSVDGTTDTWNVPSDAVYITITAVGNTPVLRGIIGGVDTRILVIVNASGSTLTVSDRAIQTANKIIGQLGSTFGLANKRSMTLWYDADVQGWRIIGGKY